MADTADTFTFTDRPDNIKISDQAERVVLITEESVEIKIELPQLLENSNVEVPEPLPHDMSEEESEATLLFRDLDTDPENSVISEEEPVIPPENEIQEIVIKDEFSSYVLETPTLVLKKPIRTYSTNKIASPMVVHSTSTPSTTILPLKSQIIINPAPHPIKPKGPVVRTYGKNKVKPEVIEPSKNVGPSPHLLPKTPKSTGPIMPPRKKRRLLLDNFKVIPNAEFKQQLIYTKDITQNKSDFAPRTKKAMHFLTYGGVGKFFAYPGRKILSVPLAKLFYSHLTVTTEIRSVQMVDGQVAPLDPELRTPPSGSSKYEGLIVSYMGPHLYNDSLAKRAANSFDHLIKGMNVSRTKKTQEDNRKSYRKGALEHFMVLPPSPHQTTEDVTEYDGICADPDGIKTEIMGSDPVELKDERQELLNPDSSEQITDDPVGIDTVNVPAGDINFPTEISENDSINIKEEFATKEEQCSQDSFVYEEVSENHEIFTEDVKPENFVEDDSGALFFCNSNETSEQEASQSNLEMLLAAAEQHHGTMEIADNIEISTEVLQDIEVDDANGDTKSGIVYCTAESDADGGLVIVDTSGRRYTISSNPSGITLWPEST